MTDNLKRKMGRTKTRPKQEVKFILRLPKKLSKAVDKEAKAWGWSKNEYIKQRCESWMIQAGRYGQRTFRGNG